MLVFSNIIEFIHAIIVFFGADHGETAVVTRSHLTLTRRNLALISAMCNSTKRFRVALALAALVTLGANAASRAGFEVRVYEDTPLNIGFATIFKSPTGGTINLSGSQAGAPDFDVSGLTVTSNSNLHAALATVTLSGTVQYLGNARGHTLFVDSTDTTFTTPVGTTYKLDSSESYTAVDVNSGDKYGFRSFADPGDTLFATTVASVGHTFGLFDPINNPSSGSNNETPAPTFTTGVPFSISNTATFFSTANGSFLNPTGSTIVTATRAVPEPGSLALLAAGLLGAAGYVRRSRAH